MIISPGRAYIFVHIPKTGGTALSLALEARARADDILIGDTPKAVRRRARVKALQSQAAGRLWKHARLADIAGLADPAEFFVLTLVRNPWDRLVSYYHWLRAQGWDHPAVRAAKALAFKDFLFDPGVALSIAGAPFGSYVTGADGAERCDLFVRLEHLEADIAPFEAHLGFRLMPLERANASDRAADYRGYYDTAGAEQVGRLCAADIARFGYAF